MVRCCWKDVALFLVVALTATPVRVRVEGSNYARSPTGAGVVEIIRAIRSKTAWQLPSKVLQPPSPPSLWTDSKSGPWAAPTVHSPDCPQRVPGLHSAPSIRTQVRLVFEDTSACRAVGNVDAGVCVRKNATAPILCFPSFIIMGTGKGGTAELQSWLSHHPNMLRIGDPNSNSGGGEPDYFGRELRTEAQLEATWRDYLHAWQPINGTALNEQYSFEKSPGYLAHSTYPKLLQLLMPSVKLVAILRDPAKRAYSHFQMVCTRENSKMNKYRLTKAEPKGKVKEIEVLGLFRKNRKGKAMPYCTADDFDNYVRKKGPVASNADADIDGLFKTGLYAADLRRWYTIFPQNQILVLFNEHFVENAIGMFDAVQSFLGVPHFDFTTLVYTSEGGYTLLKGSASKAKKLRKSYQPMSKWSKAVLDNYFAESTRDLFEMLGPENPGLAQARRTWGNASEQT